VADPEGADWRKEAEESWRWSLANTSAEDEKGRPSSGGPLRDVRAYAAAALFRLTGEAKYQEKLAEDTAKIGPDGPLDEITRWSAWIHALGGGKGAYDAALVARLRSAAIKSAEYIVLESASKRALRWGGNWWMPMLVGHQTAPWVLEGMVGHGLMKATDPAKAESFRAAVQTTADYVLGTNPLNTTWVTGLGPRHPKHVFHMDAWYNGKSTPHPGVIPYGPWKKTKALGMGPWETDWPNQTVHPPIDAWPGAERWFDNRCNPLGGEFTVHQTTCLSAAVFGWLCGPAR
jgi:endoglucanase